MFKVFKTSGKWGYLIKGASGRQGVKVLQSSSTLLSTLHCLNNAEPLHKSLYIFLVVL